MLFRSQSCCPSLASCRELWCAKTLNIPTCSKQENTPAGSSKGCPARPQRVNEAPRSKLRGIRRKRIKILPRSSLVCSSGMGADESSTARVERAHSYRARSASTEDHQSPSPPFSASCQIGIEGFLFFLSFPTILRDAWEATQISTCRRCRAPSAQT